MNVFCLETRSFGASPSTLAIVTCSPSPSGVGGPSPITSGTCALTHSTYVLPSTSGSSSKPVRSLKEFRFLKGKQWKSRVSKEKHIDEKKADDSPTAINIGLMEYCIKTETLRPKRGKRMMLRVSKDAPPKELLESAIEKFKAFNANLFIEGEEYLLLLEDCQEAVFMPGSQKEFFSLRRYQEEIGKEFRRIVLYLCTESDFRMFSGGEGRDSPMEVSDVHLEGLGEAKERELQIEDDANFARCLQEQFDNEDPEQVKILTEVVSDEHNDSGKYFRKQDTSQKGTSSPDSVEKDLVEILHTDCTSVVQAMEKQVNSSEQFFMVIRREAPLQRILELWKRESKKHSPKCKLFVKYLGEIGIDDGALTREFFSTTVPEIGKKIFPEGRPMDSTHFVQNGTFRAAGEIVSASLAQGGPPPCFLDESVFETMVNSDVNPRSLRLSHLTESERQLLQNIKENLNDQQDSIIEHGYTGVIDEAHTDDIVRSIMVSIWSKRILYLKEFKEGLQVYDLANIISQSPQACRPLFVKGHLEKVDANYLLALMHPVYSAHGSSSRKQEEDIMDYFQDFLLSLEDGRVKGYSAAVTWNYSEDGSGSDSTDAQPEEVFATADLSPEGVMGWLTGEKHRSVSGKESKITAYFDHDCKTRNPSHKICFPRASACGRSITFPTQHMSSSEMFREIFLLAYCKGQAFAQA